MAIRLPWIDFTKYRQRRYLEAVARHLWWVNFWEGSTSARSYCPLCRFNGTGGNRVGWWNLTTGFFYCHKCGGKRDAIGLVCELMKVKAVEACKWLESKAGTGGSGLVA